MAFFAFRESSGDNMLSSSPGDAFDPMSSTIAGVKNPARGAQPTMYNLLSWGDDGRASHSTTTAQSIRLPKQVVEDRWQTESQYQFCQVGHKNKKLGSKRSTVPTDKVAESVDASQSPVHPVSVPEFETSNHTQQSKHNKVHTTTTTNWKPRKSIAKKQQQLRTAKKRCELEALRSSRGLPDSALAEVYERPAFHNYGRSSLVNPWVPKEGLQTCNARKSNSEKMAIDTSPVDVKRSACPPRSTSPLKTTKTSPQKQVISQRVQSPPRPTSPAQGRSPDVPAAPLAPSVLSPVASSVPTPVCMGSPRHVRAPRIVVAPSKVLPPALAKLSANQVNNPKQYRSLNPDWTGIIKPAGTPNPRGGSVNDCLHLFA